MRIPLRSTREGFTRRDLILVLVCLLGVSCAIAPIFQKASQKSRRTACINNLKEMATGMQMYLHDSEDRFPWVIATKDGGSEGLPDVARHFLTLTGYISSPKVVSCPGLIRHRPPVQAWAMLKEKNVGYGIGLDTRVVMQMETARDFVGGQALLLTDMDIEGGEDTICARTQTPARTYGWFEGFSSCPLAGWSKTNHVRVGNASLVDGTTVTLDDQGLRRQLSLGGSHFLMPK
ncbi:MAG: DUF1559 domain-containing protein [Verrucomicrobia bacterium]|nr:DUF1559 domain-containing protein [Verrucomicrobiota bacterium]